MSKQEKMDVSKAARQSVEKNMTEPQLWMQWVWLKMQQEEGKDWSGQ